MTTRGSARTIGLRVTGTLLVLVPLAGCSSWSKGGGGATDRGFVTSDEGIARAPLAKRKPAPDISGVTLTGEPIASADYRGRILVINVWGSWCPPCRAEAPNLQQVHTETRSRGVQFLGINTRDATRTNAIAFEQEKGITYPSLWDPDARQILKFRGNLNPSAIPSTLVIDRRGNTAARALRALSVEDLRSMIDPLLAEDAPVNDPAGSTGTTPTPTARRSYDVRDVRTAGRRRTADVPARGRVRP